MDEPHVKRVAVIPVDGEFHWRERANALHQGMVETHRSPTHLAAPISEEAFRLARDFLRDTAMLMAFDVERDDVAAALRLLSLEISAAATPGALLSDCGVGLS